VFYFWATFRDVLAKVGRLKKSVQKLQHIWDNFHLNWAAL